jgi:hypothetical protein
MICVDSKKIAESLAYQMSSMRHSEIYLSNL